MTGSIVFLVDSNVFVYVFDPRDRLKQERAVTVTRLLAISGRGVVSTQVLGEFFNTVTRKLPAPLTPAEAEREVRRILRNWQVLLLTTDTVLASIQQVQRGRFSYCDGLIWATAELNGVPTILTEDGNDGTVEGSVRYLNPFNPSFDLTVLSA